MKGSIRAAVGFLMVFGAVGGIETGSDLAPCLAIAIAGLAIMAAGFSAMKTA